MAGFNKLIALLELDEQGEEIADIIANMLVDERKRNIFVTRLQEIKKQLITLDTKLELTDTEDTIRRFIFGLKRPITTQDVADKMGLEYPSLKYRTHTSAILNSLVSKGIIGKFKDGYSFYFTTPREAVMERIKKRGELPEKCSPVEIAKETGLPLEIVFNEIEALLVQ